MVRDKIYFLRIRSVSWHSNSILTFSFPQFGQISFQTMFIILYLYVMLHYKISSLGCTGEENILNMLIIIFMQVMAPSKLFCLLEQSTWYGDCKRILLRVSELHFPRNCYQKRSNHLAEREPFSRLAYFLSLGKVAGVEAWVYRLRGRISHFPGAECIILMLSVIFGFLRPPSNASDSWLLICLFCHSSVHLIYCRSPCQISCLILLWL